MSSPTIKEVKCQKSNSTTSLKFVPWEPCKAAASKGQESVIDKARYFNSQQGLPGKLIPYKLSEPVKSSNKQKRSTETETKLHYPPLFEDIPNEHLSSRKNICVQKSVKYPETSSFLDDRSSLAEADGADAPDDPFRGANSPVLLEVDYRTAIEKLNGEKRALERELELQRKVNDELKVLLVASIGEDLQSHVDALSQDKVRLGRNILDFSKQSNMEKEKVEDLAINGDVWRSKYLAASVLTDELITTKVQLLRHLRDGQTAVRQLLEEQECVRRHLIQSAALLSQIKNSLEPDKHQRRVDIFGHSNAFELAASVHSLCDGILSKTCATEKIFVTKCSLDMRPTEQNTSQSMRDAINFSNVDFDMFCQGGPCDEFRRLQGRRRNIFFGYPNTCNFRDLTIDCCKKCAGREIKLV